jgi:uncharacterized membrane protein HdeD (DUF308 family)
MTKQHDKRIWETIIAPFLTYICLFVGMGLVSGSIVHLGAPEVSRYITIGCVGMVLFVVGSYVQEALLNSDNLRQEGAVKYILYSLLLAIGVGMMSGGTQHFLDFPLYAKYLLPVGFVLALAAYVLRNNLSLSFKGWSVLIAGALGIAIPTFLGLNAYAQSLPAGSGHQHGDGGHGDGGAIVEQAAPNERSVPAAKSPGAASKSVDSKDSKSTDAPGAEHDHKGHPH